VNITVDRDPPCANLQCSNTLGEGEFSLTRIDVSGARTITLLLCSPCASALARAAS
jgi:hypothetical protein